MQARPWFKAKTYGLGWVPATWEGWLATAIYVAAFALWLVYVVKAPAHERLGLAEIAPLLLLTAGYIALSWLKGDKPRWRWESGRGQGQ
jgi:hypothetical protein